MTGHGNGDLVFWKVKTNTPIKKVSCKNLFFIFDLLSVTNDLQSDRKPIYSIVFSASGKGEGRFVSCTLHYSRVSETYCYVLGGNPKTEKTALHLVSLTGNAGSYSLNIPGSSRLIWKDNDVLSMEIIFPDPWPETRM